MRHATPLSRREFAALAAAAPLAFRARVSAGAAPTATEVIERIQRHLGVEWKPETVDGIKAGDPATPVTGIVTTSMATMAVLQQAVSGGANLVITAEPTFYSRSDGREPATSRGGRDGAGPAPAASNRDAAAAPGLDPIVTAKHALIARHRLVVFRLRDHWRLRRPDPLVQGLAATLGWASSQVTGDSSRYDVPAASLAALARRIERRLDARGGIRVIGDPRTRVRKVALLPGSTPLAAALAALPRADVVVAGEVREWESAEYARDAVDSGQQKGLVLVGRMVSEEPGMRLCANWLKALIPEVAVRHVAAGDPVLEAGVTAGEVVDRIKKNLGVPWRDATYRDTFKYGGPDTPVTGIATTAFATLTVIQKAGVAGLNMIIPHEDTFWNDRDDITVVSGDPLYQTKVDVLRKHQMVVFRIHDHMHAQRPDFTYLGSARELGLESRYETAPQSHRFVVPETTLGALAADFRRRTGARALRVVGDPRAKVRRIQLGVGYATPPVAGDVDVVVSGEQQEADGAFDGPGYVLDAVTLGVAKGWIMLGHAVSEEAGMLEMARWIGTFVPEVPVQLVRAGEPFWAPSSAPQSTRS